MMNKPRRRQSGKQTQDLTQLLLQKEQDRRDAELRDRDISLREKELAARKGGSKDRAVKMMRNAFEGIAVEPKSHDQQMEWMFGKKYAAKVMGNDPNAKLQQGSTLKRR